MKLQIGFLVTLLVLASFIQAQNILHLLSDRRYVERQISCILNRAPCDVVGKTVKGLLPEALNNDCRRCTPRQMEHAQILMGFMRQNYPNEWYSIVQYYTARRYMH
ncbi:putative odorant-binding protein A10 [Nomia melanderi]|uniref:putative odorant-binding protein A10 n=1 Tax=Nomia melanderi TaxID=2448451 RepID=UPI001304644A|nr:putative odorant-binding protein A10 [Nomia melanderi]